MLLKYKWEDWQIKYLKENYKDKSNKELAEHLDRTIDAVISKLYFLGLKRDSEYYHKIRNTYEGSIARRRVFKEWDKLFSPPPKE